MTGCGNRNRNLEALVDFLQRKKVAAMNDLKSALHTDVGMTVYRAMKKLSYRTSYSHGGRYYALNETICFDKLGLWSFQSIWFSQHGTLIKTLERFVSESESGHFAQELEGVHPQTVVKGKRELLEKDVDMQRIRKEGGGRPRTGKRLPKSSTKSKS